MVVRHPDLDLLKQVELAENTVETFHGNAHPPSLYRADAAATLGFVYQSGFCCGSAADAAAKITG
jgi:hypothetical protein